MRNHPDKTADWLRDAPRWLLLAALVYAPWAFGCTRPWTIHVLNALLAVVLGLWVARCVLRRSRPQVPAPLALAACGLILQAWWMAINGEPPSSDSVGSDAASPKPLAWPPGSVNTAASLAMAQRITVLLGLICFACDLARHATWRKRIGWTMGLTGASVVAFGLIQRLAGAPGVFWQADPDAPLFFATFKYHGNAGSFINLVWPLLAGLLVAAAQKPGAILQRVVSLAALVVCATGIFVNMSRAGSFLAVLLVVVWVGWLVAQVARERWGGIHPASAVVAVVLAGAMVGGVATVIGVDRTRERWGNFYLELTAENSRWQAARVCLRIVPEAGVCGFGPGTFAQVFPRYQGNDARQWVWHYAHNDYLQTVIEWGYGGALLWALVVLGGPVRAIWRRARQGSRWPPRDRIMFFSGLLAFGGVAVHALVDYPLQVASLQLYVAVLVGLFWGAGHWVNHRSRDTKPARDDRRGVASDAVPSASEAGAGSD